MAISTEQFRRLWVDWAVQAFQDAQDDYEKFEAYYVGDHEIEFSTDRWLETFEEEFENFSANLCGVVVDRLAERLKIVGWDCEDEECSKAAQEIWDFNDLSNEESDLYVGTISKGDGYLIVWPSETVEGEVDIFFNDALSVNVVYDSENKRKISRAAKHWFDEEGQHHLRLYFEDHIEKWIIPKEATAALYSGFRIPEEEGIMPEGWEREGADLPNPYGIVPVFHFRNGRLNSTHGLSEIKQVIPIQNAINKLLMDLMVASEFGSFRQKWMAGAGHPSEGWKAGSNRVWATTDSNAKFGEFGQVDLDPIVKAVESLIGIVAKITATPMHYLRPSGDMPSGEALKTAESGLTKKGEKRQTQFGSPWTQAMTLAVSIKLERAIDHPVNPIWDSVEIRHDLEQAQTAQLKALLGIPLEKLWAEHFGYTDEEIGEFKEINAHIVAAILAAATAQTGQTPPGDPNAANGQMNLAQVLALAGKGVTSQTPGGEATPAPQPNTTPPASPTRRSRGFKD